VGDTIGKFALPIRSAMFLFVRKRKVFF